MRNGRVVEHGAKLLEALQSFLLMFDPSIGARTPLPGGLMRFPQQAARFDTLAANLALLTEIPFDADEFVALEAVAVKMAG